MLADDWTGLLRVLVIAPIAYLALVVMLRASGPRTLAKMSAYDFVITIAIGSLLASIIVTDSVSLIEGLMAMLTLILLQFCITWMAVHSEFANELIKGDPALIYHDGRFLRSRMKRARVTESDILAAARESGHGAMDDIESVVLETDGTFSVLTGSKGSHSTLDVSLRHRDGS